MANLKSSKKRIEVNRRKRAENKIVKTAVKNSIKDLKAAIEKGDKEEATQLLSKSVSLIDKAKSKNIFHRKTRSRKISKLSKLVNNM